MRYKGASLNQKHIPLVDSIQQFFDLLRLGTPTGHDISVTRMEDMSINRRTDVPLFRNNIFRIVYLDDAQVEWNSASARQVSSNQCVYFAYPGKLESWKANLKNKGYLICFMNKFSSGFRGNAELEQVLPYFNPEGNSLLFLTEDESLEIKSLIKEMLAEANSLNTDRKRMLRYQLFQLLIKFNRLYKDRIETIPFQSRNNMNIHHKFKQELDKYFLELSTDQQSTQVSVKVIADRMALTPGYLSTAVKEVTGKPAAYHIQVKTILEAKSYLLMKQLQVVQIARLLGFNNASYFTRFFKKNTGETPKSYQKSIEINNI